MGGSAVEKLQVQMRKGYRESPPARLLAICLTNRGVARLAVRHTPGNRAVAGAASDGALPPEPMADFRAAIAA